MNRIIRMDETHMAQPVEPEFAAAVGEPVPDETVAVDPMHLRIVEALLFAASEPLNEQALAQSLQRAARRRNGVGGRHRRRPHTIRQEKGPMGIVSLELELDDAAP